MGQAPPHGRTTPLVGRPDPVLAGLVATTAALGLWSAFGGAAEGVLVAAFWLVQPAFDLVMVLCSRRVCRIPGLDPSISRFWRWLARGGLLLLAGDTAQLVEALSRPGRQSLVGTPLQGTLVAGGIAVMVLVALTHPIGLTGPARWRMWLDAATVMIGAAVFLWYLNGGQTSAQVAAVSVVTLVAAFGLVKLALAPRPPFTRGATLVGIAGVASFGVVTALSPGAAPDGSLGAWLVLRLLPLPLIAAAPRVQELQVRADLAVLTRPRRRPYSVLPYVAVGATQLLVLVVGVQGRLTGHAWGVLIGGVATTALVVVRQLASLHDNAALLARLDSTLVDLRLQEQRFRSLVQHGADITVVLDAGGEPHYASPAAERVLGLVVGGGTDLTGLLHPDDAPETRAFWSRVTQHAGVSLHHTLRVRHVDGSVRWLDVIATNLLDDPSVRGVVCNARDVTEARAQHDRLSYEASHDPLTGLLNRAAFEDRLTALRPRADLASLAVLLIDLDDFKPVNDQYGHHVGDALLVEVAARLQTCFRSQDAVARLGGDEFAVLLPGLDADQARTAASRAADLLREPVGFEGLTLQVRASVGTAVGRPQDAPALVREADAAMYRAKQGRAGRRPAGAR